MMEKEYKFYYITIIYKLWNILPALINIKLAISISGPVSNITIGPGPNVLFDISPAFLQFDRLTICVGLYMYS